jgi:hypothetical protein
MANCRYCGGHDSCTRNTLHLKAHEEMCYINGVQKKEYEDKISILAAELNKYKNKHNALLDHIMAPSQFYDKTFVIKNIRGYDNNDIANDVFAEINNANIDNHAPAEAIYSFVEYIKKLKNYRIFEILNGTNEDDRIKIKRLLADMLGTLFNKLNTQGADSGLLTTTVKARNGVLQN